MSRAAAEQPPADQYERTLLAWRRTALSLVAAGALVGHLALGDEARPALALMLAGVALVVGFVWLSRDRRIGVTGLALLAGVVLLGVTALVGIATQ